MGDDIEVRLSRYRRARVFAANAGRLLVDLTAFSMATRRTSLLVTVVVAALLGVLTLAVKVVAPVAIYPFV